MITTSNIFTTTTITNTVVNGIIFGFRKGGKNNAWDNRLLRVINKDIIVQ